MRTVGQMKTILVLTALLLVPATAHGWTERLTVPPNTVLKWKTPQELAWGGNWHASLHVNGRRVGFNGRNGYEVERRKCRMGWTRPRLLVDWTMPCRRYHRATVKIANLRAEKITARLRWWYPERLPSGPKVEKRG